MPFPLTGTALSGALRVVEPPPDAVGFIPTGRTWSLRHTQYLFTPSERTASVAVIDTPSKIVARVMIRRWNGVGGVSHLPSFPQLNKGQTSWPHAT